MCFRRKRGSEAHSTLNKLGMLEMTKQGAGYHQQTDDQGCPHDPCQIIEDTAWNTMGGRTWLKAISVENEHSPQKRSNDIFFKENMWNQFFF